MSGETDLNKLLGSMQPVLSESEYVFASLQKDSPVSVTELAPLGTFYEKEGLTVIVSKTNADISGLAYEGVFQCITLNVHSSLDAVGLTAAVSTALTGQNISANVVAAYYHDHIFVPIAKASQALSCLQKLANDSK
ncbi:ACT domain-containing protein [Paraglaciecola arctica]|uniref:Transporter n=1 Tax=Paraglaciecola arctica BSs20135 TaxID=493475 RepID=K6YWI9_9ALTE|nr:ACT domain-containing protein [Paraglaciecola arctica]GAC21103.1 transporter [Paraglaciecola arctica BSs20135]